MRKRRRLTAHFLSFRKPITFYVLTTYLAGVLDSLGYQVLVRTRRWTAADIPWKPEIDRIRKNIQKLYAAYHYLPDFREITITGSMDFEQANVLEWDLHAIYIWLNRMMTIFWHSGSFSLNEGGFA